MVLLTNQTMAETATSTPRGFANSCPDVSNPRDNGHASTNLTSRLVAAVTEIVRTLSNPSQLY